MKNETKKGWKEKIFNIKNLTITNTLLILTILFLGLSGRDSSVGISDFTYTLNESQGNFTQNGLTFSGTIRGGVITDGNATLTAGALTLVTQISAINVTKVNATDVVASKDVNGTNSWLTNLTLVNGTTQNLTITNTLGVKTINVQTSNVIDSLATRVNTTQPVKLVGDATCSPLAAGELCVYFNSTPASNATGLCIYNYTAGAKQAIWGVCVG